LITDRGREIKKQRGKNLKRKRKEKKKKYEIDRC